MSTVAVTAGMTVAGTAPQVILMDSWSEQSRRVECSAFAPHTLDQASNPRGRGARRVVERQSMLLISVMIILHLGKGWCNRGGQKAYPGCRGEGSEQFKELWET